MIDLAMAILAWMVVVTCGGVMVYWLACGVALVMASFAANKVHKDVYRLQREQSRLAGIIREQEKEIENMLAYQQWRARLSK